jgi:AraC-like DNA-binding protein
MHAFKAGDIIYPSMLQRDHMEDYKHDYKTEDELLNSINQGNYINATESLEMLFMTLKVQALSLTRSELKNVYRSLLSSISRNCLKGGNLLPEELLHSVKSIILKDYCDIISAQEAFKSMVEGIISENKENRNVNLIIEKLLNYIQENYAKDLSLEELAEIAGLSVQYFSKVFKDYTQMTLVPYLTEIRMEKAVDMLIHTDKSVMEIAELVGYRNAQYFIRVFNKKFSISPMQYRRRQTLHSLQGDKGADDE